MVSKNSILKYVLFGIFIMTAVPAVFAQAKSLDIVFSEIDKLIVKYADDTENRTAAIVSALDSYAGNPNFPSIEMYVLKKARYYIIYANYPYARDIAYAVVDHNLDNIDAAVLYDAANKAISRQEEEQLTAEALKREQEREAQIKEEKIKDELRKGYKVASTASGETVYFDQNVNIYYSPYIWNFAMRFADFSMGLGSDELSVQYGAGAQASFFYYRDSFAVGGEAQAEMSIISMAGTSGMFNTIKFAGCFGMPIKRSLLCARLGVFVHNSDMKNTSDAFISPLAGIGWRDIHIGSSSFSAYFDYFPGHFMQDGLYFAGEAGANISFPLFKSDAVVMSFTVGFQDTVMLYSGGPQNKAEFVFALGVGNNE